MKKVMVAEPPIHAMEHKQRQAAKPMQTRTVAIMGTAGQDPSKEDVVDAHLWKVMVHCARQVLTRVFSLDASSSTETVQLISGGAAIADHVAVQLYLESSSTVGTSAPSPYHLSLHLPCRWDPDRKEYDARSYEGRRSNALHVQFARQASFPSVRTSLQQLHDVVHQSSAARSTSKAAANRVTVQEHSGFVQRNSFVAREAQYVLAMTWSSPSALAPVGESGAAHTWSRSNGVKLHLPLAELVRWYPNQQDVDWESGDRRLLAFCRMRVLSHRPPVQPGPASLSLCCAVKNKQGKRTIDAVSQPDLDHAIATLKQDVEATSDPRPTKRARIDAQPLLERGTQAHTRHVTSKQRGPKRGHDVKWEDTIRL
jgi:hypothetical protein